MDLPKLYRVVYLEIEWITDTCEGGEHVQRGGVYYTPARLVLDGGVKRWQTLDPNFDDPYFEADDLEDFDWHPYDIEYKEWLDENRHNPNWGRTYATIKEQAKQKQETEDFKKISDNFLSF